MNVEKLDNFAPDGVELQVQLSRCFVAGRGEEALLPLRIFFYIDALNLYYGALRHTSFRWLDIGAFCDAILRERAHFNTVIGAGTGTRPVEIAGIKMFTANLKKMPWDPGAPDRQKLYLTALRAHVPLLDIQCGKFNVREVEMHDAKCPEKKHKVIRPEEKSSDVNLALHMLNDAVNDEYDFAVMVSNDTDLLGALEMVREREKMVGVIFPAPDTKKAAQSLRKNADFYLNVRPQLLADCQLPNFVRGKNEKMLHKPEEWNLPRKQEKWRGEYKTGSEDLANFSLKA